MRDYKEEYARRTDYIRSVVSRSGADGIVYGNSGGKDSSLVGILCKAACDNTLGVIMPCSSNRNYTMDATDAMAVARRYGIEVFTTWGLNDTIAWLHEEEAALLDYDGNMKPFTMKYIEAFSAKCN